MEANLTRVNNFFEIPVYKQDHFLYKITLGTKLEVVYKNKSTNYIWCLVSVSQVAKNLWQYPTSIYMVESYLYEWYFHFMLQHN